MICDVIVCGTLRVVRFGLGFLCVYNVCMFVLLALHFYESAHMWPCAVAQREAAAAYAQKKWE